MPEAEAFVLPESGGRRVESVQVNVSCSCKKRVRPAPKKQQKLIGVIRSMWQRQGIPVTKSAGYTVNGNNTTRKNQRVNYPG